jgi:hypothetical protein
VTPFSSRRTKGTHFVGFVSMPTDSCHTISQNAIHQRAHFILSRHQITFFAPFAPMALKRAKKGKEDCSVRHNILRCLRHHRFLHCHRPTSLSNHVTNRLICPASTSASVSARSFALFTWTRTMTLSA